MPGDAQRPAEDSDDAIDAAFARFAMRGDPDALAEVFDRSAPRLSGAGRGEDSPQDPV